MPADQLSQDLLSPKENSNIEFKEAKATYDYNKLLKYCVALANEGGGRLILGVTDAIPRQIVGSSAFKNFQGTQNQILDKLGFRVDVEELSVDQKRVLVFHIPGRPSGTAYNLDGAFWMRSTDELVPMSEDRLRAIFHEGRPDWFSQFVVTGISGDQVIEMLDSQSFFELLKSPYPTNQAGVLEKFSKFHLIEKNSSNWDITNLGGILFAKNIQDFDSLSRKSVRVIVYEGTSKLKTKSDRTGRGGYAVGFVRLIDHINSMIPANEVIGKALRKETKMFPESAIRELVANALIHQDFKESGTSVLIEIYSDRIEISNPGKPAIPPERFIDENQSRNEKLAEIMRRFGICEEKGSGIDRVIESSEIFQLPAPDFRVSDLRTTAVLFSHIEFEDMDRNDKIRACYQHACLKWVMNDRMTNQSLRERFKLPESKSETASRIIRDTVEANRVKLEDPSNTSKRYAKYVPYWA